MQNQLTRLPGRSELFEALAASLEPSGTKDGSVGLVAVQVRRLREINLELGYEIGDLVLGRLAAQFQAILRPSDMLVHLGSAEFALLLFDIINRGRPCSRQTGYRRSARNRCRSKDEG